MAARDRCRGHRGSGCPAKRPRAAGGSTRRGLAGSQHLPALRRADGERGPRKKNARLRPRASAPPGLGLGREMERWREAFAKEESSGGRESGVERAGEGRERGCSGRRSTKRPRRRQLVLQRGSWHALELTWKQGHRPPSRPESRVKTCNSPRGSAECSLWLYPSPCYPQGRQGKDGSRGSLVPMRVASLSPPPHSTQPRLPRAVLLHHAPSPPQVLWLHLKLWINLNTY